MQIPQNVGQMTRFPSKAGVMVREFAIDADGVITITPWLASQVNRHCPEARQMTGEKFINRAVQWFKCERVRHNLAKRRTPRKPRGLVSFGDELEKALAHSGVRV